MPTLDNAKNLKPLAKQSNLSKGSPKSNITVSSFSLSCLIRLSRRLVLVRAHSEATFGVQRLARIDIGIANSRAAAPTHPTKKDLSISPQILAQSPLGKRGRETGSGKRGQTHFLAPRNGACGRP